LKPLSPSRWNSIKPTKRSFKHKPFFKDWEDFPSSFSLPSICNKFQEKNFLLLKKKEVE